METKKDIRARILHERKEMPYENWWANSRKICETVTAHPFFLNAEEIYCYMDYRQEVATKSIFEEAWRLNKKTAAPVICGNEMHFQYINSFQDVELGMYQIREPNTGQLANGKNVLIIMPGAVFDKNRNRIGYGKGYYDVYLHQHPHVKTMAIAFELQIVDSIPAEIHDYKPDIIITEENIYD